MDEEVRRHIPLAKDLIVLVTVMSPEAFFSFCAMIPTSISCADIGASGFFIEDLAAFVLPGVGDGFGPSELLGSEEYGGGESLVPSPFPDDCSAGAG